MYTLAGAGASRFGLTENKQGLSQSSMILRWEFIKENKKTRFRPRRRLRKNKNIKKTCPRPRKNKKNFFS